jgi:hypothetical protein
MKTPKTSVRIARLLAKIRTGHLPNWRKKRYRLILLLGQPSSSKVFWAFRSPTLSACKNWRTVQGILLIFDMDSFTKNFLKIQILSEMWRQ